ncbi:MAG: hypothetical protein ACRD0O_12495 [Acidimicrobiia bacterium]
MPTELQELIADLEVSIVDTMERMNEAELNLLYVGVLDLEQRIEALYDGLAMVADRIAVEGPTSRARTPGS